MSAEWSEATWGEIATLEYGKAIRDYQNASGGVPVYGTNGPIGWHHTPLCKSDGVVIGRKGAYRGVHYSPKPFFVIDTAFYLKPKIELSVRWAYYCLLTYDINGMDSGSAIPSTSRDEFYKLPVKVPALAEQNRVVEVLSLLDDRITLLRETNTTLEAIAQALFKSWFVDFDPVRAKAEGRQPDGMDATTASLFPDSFEESELGLVPKGWRAGLLSDLASFQNGYAFKSQDWVDTGHPVVKIGDVKPGLIDFSGCSRVAPTTVVGLERFKLSRGDLLVGMTGYVGETGLVPRIEPDAYINQRVGRLVTRAGLTDIGMIYCAVRDPAYKVYAESQSHGSAQANVSGAALLAYPLVIPRPDVLYSFNRIVEPLLESILANHEQAQTLTQLRDTLLPRLISGQLRLPEAETVLNDRDIAE